MPSSAGRTVVPLRALPTPLPSRCDWLTERVATRPPILSHHVGDVVEFVLDAPAGATLRGSVRLAEQAWRDALGTADVTVAVVGHDASWTARLPTAAEGSAPQEHGVTLEIPPTEDGPARVRFSIAAAAPRGCPRVDRVFWRDLRLEIPRAAAGGPAAPAPVATPSVDVGTGSAAVVPGRPAPDAPAAHPDAASRSPEDVPAAGEDGSPVAHPAVSIVMPVCDPDPALLRTTLDSVHAQSSTDWELVITDDASTDPAVLRMLEDETRRHPGRVVVETHEVRANISAATNTALAVARGPWVVMLDHDDLLHPDAVAEVLAVVAREDPDIVYSDDEIEYETGRKVVSSKPGFSVDMIRGLMYTHHLSAYRRSAIERIGGLRSAFDGSQDYDMMLRLLDHDPKVVHVPRVLYTWRAHALSMAGNPHSKPFAYARGHAALGEHLQRSGVGGEIVYGAHPGRYRHLPAWPDGTTASLAVAVPDGDALRALAETLEGWRQDGDPLHVVVGTTPGLLDAVEAALDAAGVAPDARTVVATGDGAPAGALAAGALAAAAAAVRTEVAVLLQRPVHRLSSRTVRTLGAHALLPDVHAAGLRILDAEGRVESTGVVVRDGAPQRILAGGQGNDHGPCGIGRFTRAVAALDDVVVTTRADLERLGGLDASLGDHALADLCLRGNRTGTHAVLLADLLAGRPTRPLPTVALDDLATFAERWAADADATRPDLTPLQLGEASSKTTIRDVLRPA